MSLPDKVSEIPIHFEFACPRHVISVATSLERTFSIRMPEKPRITRNERSAILRYVDVSGCRLEFRDTDYLRRSGLDLLGPEPESLAHSSEHTSHIATCVKFLKFTLLKIF